jgi:two-component system heavy metal sensor histidine kinase CusS
VADAQPIAAKNNVRLELTRCDVVQCQGDRAKLRQALLNLLENGLKHNYSGGWLHVALCAGPRDSTLTLENTGPTIPPDLLPRMFDRFVRGNDATEGAGLGLSITKVLIEAHGGTISCVSRLEGGARFVVKFPSAPATA